MSSVRAQIVQEIQTLLDPLAPVVLSRAEVLVSGALPAISLDIPNDDVSDTDDSLTQRDLTIAIGVFADDFFARETLIEQVELALYQPLRRRLTSITSAADDDGDQVMYGASLSYTIQIFHTPGDPTQEI